MSYTTRSFTREQVAASDSTTTPVRVGPDGIVSVTLLPQSGNEHGRSIGFGLQINLDADKTVPAWANMRNVGDPNAKLYKGRDETGLMEMHIINGSAYGFNNVVPGAWVRVGIYRLDETSHPINVAVRTSFGETFLETPVTVKNPNLGVTVRNANLDVTVQNDDLDVTVQNDDLDVIVKNDVVETENENQWVSKVGDNA